MNDLNTTGSIVLISGPSGAGKSSLVGELEKNINNIYFSVSVTTRKMRKGEVEGVDYHFVSKDEFEKDIASGMFLEWAEVHGNYYGTSIKYTTDALKAGKQVVFDIDVQGHEQIKKKLKDITTSVFVTTATLKDLQMRLLKRGTDSAEQIKKRIQNAKNELSYIKDYDYLIVNDDFEIAKRQLFCIVEVAKIKTLSINTDKFIKVWSS